MSTLFKSNKKTWLTRKVGRILQCPTFGPCTIVRRGHALCLRDSVRRGHALRLGDSVRRDHTLCLRDNVSEENKPPDQQQRRRRQKVLGNSYISDNNRLFSKFFFFFFFVQNREPDIECLKRVKVRVQTARTKHRLLVRWFPGESQGEFCSCHWIWKHQLELFLSIKGRPESRSHTTCRRQGGASYVSSRVLDFGGLDDSQESLIIDENFVAGTVVLTRHR